MTVEKDSPMPSGVEAMSKQQLWNWFHRSSTANAEKSSLSRKFFVTTTGLHPSYSAMMNNPWAVIEAQRKRMAGLELQMAQMQKGYATKLRKELAKAPPAQSSGQSLEAAIPKWEDRTDETTPAAMLMAMEQEIAALRAVLASHPAPQASAQPVAVEPKGE